MYFENYFNKKVFKNLRDAYGSKQHNILVIVGNGFDISVCNRYDKRVTTYENFYKYYEKNSDICKNAVMKKVAERKNRIANWADFEEVMAEFADQGNVNDDMMNRDIRDIQKSFNGFMNGIVDHSLMNSLSNDSEKNCWAKFSLSQFLKDMSRNEYKRCKFPSLVGHYNLLNFLFINLNFTPLLDNYLYLDRRQFDPHMHKMADTNFWFYPNPNSYDSQYYGCGNSETKYSDYLILNVVHPHGRYEIPRSMLFGAEKNMKSIRKSYWARYTLTYGPEIENANLFIIYGCSIGSSDRWWWESILKRMLADSDVETIVYFYDRDNNISDSDIKDSFLNYIVDEDPSCDTSIIESRIHIVKYSSSGNTNFLGFADRES